MADRSRRLSNAADLQSARAVAQHLAGFDYRIHRRKVAIHRILNQADHNRQQWSTAKVFRKREGGGASSSLAASREQDLNRFYEN